MLHVRVICPPGKTAEALAALRAEPGARLITVRRGAAVEPSGDVLEADVVRESADDVVAALEALGVGGEGGIMLGPIDTALPESADRAVAEASGDRSVVVIRESPPAESRNESTPNPAFLAFITIACLLAAVGVATDSTVTIVGAIVAGPEFGPLAALAASLARKDFGSARRSAPALIAGYFVAMVITWAAMLVWEQFGRLSLDSVDRIHNVELICRMGPFSPVVALLAGAARMLWPAPSKSAALPEVFISVTTIPAAGFAVVAATVGAWDEAFSSIGLLGLNMAGIVVAGWLVLWLRPRRGGERGLLDRFGRYRAPAE